MAKELLNLGELYVSDFVNGDMSRAQKHELKIVMDEAIGAPRLEKPAPLDIMYGKYWYRSGLNDSMKSQLQEIVQSILPLIKHNEKDIWLDIACNDGTLLGYVPKDFLTVGFDPAEESITERARKNADIIVPDYFSSEMYNKMLRGRKAKIITTIAMFYDLEDPVGFAKQVEQVMDDEGLWVIQMSYTPLMLRQVAFDNICHEHIYYHSFFSMVRVLTEAGMRIVDCTLNETNGGSFRLYIRKAKASVGGFATQAMRDVAAFRCESMVAYEGSVNWKDAWEIFHQEIRILKSTTVGFIKREVNLKGKTVMGYGASTKGNTLLQYFGLDNTLITAIADRNPDKWGLKTIGSNIPIISENDMRQAQPDYLLILPWHFIGNFIEREKDYLNKGGKFIVPCPKFEIISA